jgi:hypothetical protein
LEEEGDARSKDIAESRLFPKHESGGANRSATFSAPEIEKGFLKQRLWRY